MSLTVDPAPESLHPDGDEDKHAADSPPSSVVTPNVEADSELPTYDGDATQDTAPYSEQDNDHLMEDASVVPQIDSAPNPCTSPLSRATYTADAAPS